jgi:hypothetical protein
VEEDNMTAMTPVQFISLSRIPDLDKTQDTEKIKADLTERYGGHAKNIDLDLESDMAIIRNF